MRARDGEKEEGAMMRTRVVVAPPSFRPRPWRVLSDQTSRRLYFFEMRSSGVDVQLIENFISVGIIHFATTSVVRVVMDFLSIRVQV